MEDFVAGEELASVANGLDVRLFEGWRLQMCGHGQGSTVVV